ncbi:flagellar motor protein MotB [Cellulomonas bogoriensis]|uniref:OmpA-like domain-containing protein n=1 Tax=Cellulomonas bogoriensis 69B4 = DSM 16987 TaxID=1386082 RepID=A0A0A0BMZ3_9CELL|nr:flagellar motor protein MotB [Cellulomonas bogoriensis]KGM09321.1 hypothetical protein N869_06430 [Cellulomonas bogoriensis 69B4 = DSM 16987]
MSSGHGSGGHGRKAKRQMEEEHENHERWAVSYADMMTVLVGLFIVMYAISSVDETKFEQLRDSLAVGFGPFSGPSTPSILESGTGPLPLDTFEITPDLAAQAAVEFDRSLAASVDEDADVETPDERSYRLAVGEYDRLSGIADEISDALAAEGLSDRVRYRVTDRGLFIGMVADDVFFAADAARLTSTAKRVIDTIGPILADLPEEISVEGHANVLPSVRYATNWELSSDRATQVLRRLVENNGLRPDRISSVGFGEARPLESAGGVEALEANRRVDLVVLSSAPETVRELLPSVAAVRAE